MHLEVFARLIVHRQASHVSILVSNWMHLEVCTIWVLTAFRHVSILVSNWMHLEVDNLQMFTVYNA